MIPLALAVVLLTAYHLLMLITSFLMRLFSRRRELDEAATSDVFKVHV
jgi:hypothetical protein